MDNILLITIDFWPHKGGVANYYGNLCHQLGGQVAVLTNKESGVKNQALKNFNFKIIRKKLLVNWLWPKWLLMGWYVWQAVRWEKIDKIWVGEILPTGTVVYYLSKILKLPYVVSCHGMDILQAQKVKRKAKMAHKILSGAQWVTANSRYTGKLVQELGVDKNKIKLVYPGVDYLATKRIKNLNIFKEKFIKQYNLTGKQIILSVGRLVARKGFDKVIQAMPEIIAKVPQALYLVVGDGPDKERLSAISNQQPATSNQPVAGGQRVIFLGEVSEDEKWALLDMCDVFVTPARQSQDDVEGFGIVYLEANLMAKPVVAGKSGGAQEAVVDGQSGLLVNPESVEEISQAIIKLLSDKELADKLGKQGRERAIREFNWEKQGREIKKILNFKL